jgi:hypothetical protein
VSASYFPLREGASWVYVVSSPLQKIIKVVVEPQMEIEVEDLVTHVTRPERAWVLREDDAREPIYAVVGEHGVQILRTRRFGAPSHTAIVVHEDLRWGGAPTWSRPSLSYGHLATLRYERVGEEDLIVTAGRFRCLKILIDEGEVGAVWLAPGVGIVREAHLLEGIDRYSVVELGSPPTGLD